MNDERREEQDQEQTERPRPRVVDKRVSSGKGKADGPPPTDESAASKAAGPAEQDTPAGPSLAEEDESAVRAGSSGEPVWTPEQEAQARELAQEMARIPALDWVANAAITLVNVAATKLDKEDVAEARLAIDALAGMISGAGDALGDVQAPLRQTLAQLQMAYAQKAAPPE